MSSQPSSSKAYFKDLILRGVIDRRDLPHPLTKKQARAVRERARAVVEEAVGRKDEGEIPF